MKRIKKLFSVLALALLTSASLMAQDTDPFPEVDIHKYSLTMTVTGYVTLDGEKLTKDNDVVVAVYQGDEIRGKGTLADYGEKYKDMLMMTVRGEKAGEPLIFKVYTDGRILEADQGLTFQSNENVGTVVNPYYINLSSFLLGDVNGDGFVTISDAVALVNYILGQPSTNFIMAAADLNNDSYITISDAVAIVNIILTKPTN